MGVQRAWVIGILLVAGLVPGGAAGPAWAQGHLGISGALYQPEDDELDRTEIFGIRGGYRFAPSFGFEAGLSRLDLADTIPFEDDEPSIPELDFDVQLDVYNLDLSLQWFPRGGPFVVFAGPGLARFDAEVSVSFLGQTFSESESEDVVTAHAGLGYRWQIGERFFIRPEARVRRYFDDDLSEAELEEEGLNFSYKATDYEVGLMLGWQL